MSTHSTLESAQAEEAELRSSIPTPPDRQTHEILVNTFCLPEQDENGSETGNWVVGATAGWKAWIGGSKYGNSVIAYGAWEDVWAVLDENHRNVRASIEGTDSATSAHTQS